MKPKYKTFTDGNMAVRNWMKTFFPYHFEFKYENRDEMLEWNREHFGINLYKSNVYNSKCVIQNENAVWDFWGQTLMFKNKNDFMFFKLRWGGYEYTV
jgi:hypothetical protein